MYAVLCISGRTIVNNQVGLKNSIKVISPEEQISCSQVGQVNNVTLQNVSGNVDINLQGHSNNVYIHLENHTKGKSGPGKFLVYLLKDILCVYFSRTN